MLAKWLHWSITGNNLIAFSESLIGKILVSIMTGNEIFWILWGAETTIRQIKVAVNENVLLGTIPIINFSFSIFLPNYSWLFSKIFLCFCFPFFLSFPSSFLPLFFSPSPHHFFFFLSLYFLHQWQALWQGSNVILYVCDILKFGVIYMAHDYISRNTAST